MHESILLDYRLETGLKTTQNEIFRRMGRNLLLFQHIERLLKYILSYHKAESTLVDFKKQLQKRADTFDKTMFGILVGEFCDEVLKNAGAEIPEEESPADLFTFSFRISGNAEFVEVMRRDLKLITEQRNELVHSFLPRWQPDSPEKLDETLDYLDVQRENVLPMYENLRTIASHMQESWKKLPEFMASEEYQKKTEQIWLQASPLVLLLRDVASQAHRKDGWTYLAHAGMLANKELPEDVENLKERYGFKTLKKLLIGSEMFDVFDEPLSEGQFRTLYKNKGMH